jgi:hypothetical protein
MGSFVSAVIASVLVYAGTGSGCLGWATFVALNSINCMIQESK